MNERDVADYARERLTALGIDLSSDEAVAVVGTICEAVLLGLLRDGKVLISTFGAFQAKQRGVAVNFMGEEVTRQMRCITFRPSRRLLLVFRSLLEQGLDYSNLGESWWQGQKKASGIKSKSSSKTDRPQSLP